MTVVMETDCKSGATTATVALALRLLEVAVTVAVPNDLAVARPPLTVTMFPGVLDQATVLETSWVLPSVNVPVALSCTEWFGVNEELCGPTTIDTSPAAFTVRADEPVTDK